MRNLELTEEEKIEVEVTYVEEDVMVRRGKLNLIGLVVFDITINKDAL